MPEKHKKSRKKDKKESSSEESSSECSHSWEETESKKEDKKKRNGKNLMPEKYDGTTPLTIFLGKMESCAKYNGWDEEDKAMHLGV